MAKSGPRHGELSLKQLSRYHFPPPRTSVMTTCRMSCGGPGRGRFVYHKLLLSTICISPSLMRLMTPLTSNGRVNLMTNSNEVAFKSDSSARLTPVRQSLGPPPLEAFIMCTVNGPSDVSTPVGPGYHSTLLIFCTGSQTLPYRYVLWVMTNSAQVPVTFARGRFSEHNAMNLVHEVISSQVHGSCTQA